MQRLTNKMRGLSTCGQDDDTHPGQAMTKRKLLSKEILRTLAPRVTAIRSRNDYDPAQFLALADKVHSLSDKPWMYLPLTTLTPYDLHLMPLNTLASPAASSFAVFRTDRQPSCGLI